MKRCPTCNQTFTDQTLSFCTEDGTPLVQSEAPFHDSEATIVVPSSPSPSAPAYQPPGQFAPQPGVKKRRTWPWVVGIVVLLLFAVAGLGVVAAIVVPNMLRAANENHSNANANTERNTNANQVSNVNSNVNTNSFANTNRNENANSNANGNANTVASEAPTDVDEVLSDLTDLEKQWTEANFSADRKTLARILADDYVGTQPDGSMQGKADYLRDIKPEKIKDWELKDLKLTLKGDRATLKGRMRLEREGENEERVVQFTDKFVWRDDRWQAVASEVSLAQDN